MVSIINTMRNPNLFSQSSRMEILNRGDVRLNQEAAMKRMNRVVSLLSVVVGIKRDKGDDFGVVGF